MPASRWAPGWVVLISWMTWAAVFSISRNVGWIAAGARYGATAIDTRSRTLFALDDLEKNSVDYYAALKSAYTQQRADLIRQKREKTDGKAEIDRRDNLALVR